MMSRFFFCLTLFILIPESFILGQSLSFQEVSLVNGIYISYDFTYLGEGVNFFDFDEDGWDDLTLCQTNGPVILYKNMGGYFEPHHYFYAGQQAISSCWGDLNNDGQNDLIITTYDNGIHIYQNVNNLTFNDVTSESNILAQNATSYSGIAMADINRDGLLDVAIANYNDQGKNLYLLNQDNLHFETLLNDASFLNVQKHAFQPAFIDINKDLWPDIYMINDFYEGNEYYWNYGGLNISDNDTTLGLNIASDAMSNSWNDFDRDGDMDLYVTNRFFGNHLMRQNDNFHFENVVESSGTNVLQWCWSATWMDPDNNGLTDLMITQNSTDIITDTSGNYLFINQNDGTFQLNNETTHFPTNGFASAVGDFDNNGKCDVGISTRQGYTFELYQNTTSITGNYIKFRLEGHFSNRNGVGTHYEVWTNNRRQNGYTQAGENYISQNSQNKLIGIGDYTSVDSIILTWPSGIIDKYYNLESNQLHILHEAQNPDWWTISDTILCDFSDTIWMETSPQVQPQWWDNSSSPSKAITQPGIYSFTLGAPFGLSKTFTIQIHHASEYLEISTTNNNCNPLSEGEIHLQNTWNNSEIYVAQQLASGTYPISIEILGCAIDTTIQIFSNESWLWDLPDTIWTCEATLPDWNYWDNQSANTLVASAIEQIENLYLTTWQNPQGCVRDTLIQVYVPTAPTITLTSSFIAPSWLCQLDISGIEGPYTTQGLAWENGNIFIDNPGNYPFTVIDGWGCTYTDTLSISPITEISSFKRANEIWLYDPPYLIGPNTDDIRIINAIGQQLPTKKIGNFWLIPENTSPRWVHSNGSFYNIGWIMRK